MTFLINWTATKPELSVPYFTAHGLEAPAARRLAVKDPVTIRAFWHEFGVPKGGAIIETTNEVEMFELSAEWAKVGLQLDIRPVVLDSLAKPILSKHFAPK